MRPLGLSVNKLALELHVPATRILEIVHERRRITAETALRLARYFHTNAEFWLNLQNFFRSASFQAGRKGLRNRASSASWPNAGFAGRSLKRRYFAWSSALAKLRWIS